MSHTDVRTLFSPYIKDSTLLEKFATAKVESIEVNRKEAFLRARLRLDSFLPFEQIADLEKAFLPLLPICVVARWR